MPDPDAVYCAPWCGRGCTLDEHDAAWHGGVILAARLTHATDLSWTPRHWENLGWHYAACLGEAEVYPSHAGGYTCIINSGGGVSVVGRGDDPESTFLDARTQLRDRMVAIARDLREMGGLT